MKGRSERDAQLCVKDLARLRTEKWKPVSVSIDFRLWKPPENFSKRTLLRRKLREMELFFHISEIWYMTLARDTHVPYGKCDAGYFPSGKKTFASALNLRRIALRCGKFELRSLYRIDSISDRAGGRGRGDRGGGEASGYTSDKWWIGNKWGILTGNIRDIKKEPCTPRRISHIERLKSDTPVLSESNKGHVQRDMEYSRDTSVRPRLSPFWGKNARQSVC